MTNWRDPAVIASDGLAFIKFTHAIDGVWIWEYFTTLNYEWEVFTGRRPYRWTIVIYTLTRLATTMAVVMNLIGMNVASGMNCPVYMRFNLLFAYVAFSSASALIVLRVIAIWNRNVYASIIASAVWLTNVGFLIDGMIRVHDVQVPGVGCVTMNTMEARDNITVTLASDVTLLVLMLVGLLRARSGGSSGIWRLLYTQGLVWLLGATVGELPPAIFINLNLNDPFNIMFQTPGLLIMEICATRMYRSLTNFTTMSTVGDSNRGAASSAANMRFGRPGGATVERNATVIPMSRMEVSVHTAYEEHDSDHASDKHTWLSVDGNVGDVGKRGPMAV
ncbi:hypothetical protein FA95DRAFT_755209 [Auriscalpium vulgare]|uniref:Uncharacterized protein n=1 Tax=Auriscalpium vulgare TaxID=40419 RepID=A0ACB8SC27_9AGAM|nr:hypothetical protein FA95DRAFT_755209 [Auriscalpium vulgare]